MQWLAENWIWVVVIAAFIGMHLFGHGGHGGHGSGGCGGGNRPKDKDRDAESEGPKTASGHRH